MQYADTANGVIARHSARAPLPNRANIVIGLATDGRGLLDALERYYTDKKHGLPD